MRVRSPWVWTIFALVIVIVFVVLESLALVDTEGLSLSQWYVNITQAWPPIKTLIGIVIGILICHFGWWWVPKQQREKCPLGCGYERLKNLHGG